MLQYNFRNDYGQVGHSKMLEALQLLGQNGHTGYCLDYYCVQAEKLLQKQIGRDVVVHFLIGGTSANKIAISHLLKPYQAVISARTGHINVHETGAIEATGHKVLAVKTKDGKLTPELIKGVIREHVDEHMVMPKMVYISQATELGTVYSKEELKSLFETCRQLDLLFYIDGARLGVALVYADLTLAEIAQYCDAFTIGGTKNGMLIGEALVICRQHSADFRFTIKREAGLLAKGFIIGAQFLVAFQEGLFWELAKHANAMAKQLKDGLRELEIKFFIDSPTNQQFIILPLALIEKLKQVCDFEEWGSYDTNQGVVRFVTSWATQKGDVAGILNWFKKQIGG